MTGGAHIDSVARVDLWDAVVIGAGPGGAVAARQLALEGRLVLLVEKARLPREKVCGGCLGGAALDALESMGLSRLTNDLGGVPLRRFELCSGGSTASIPIGRRVAVSRSAFDMALVREALQAGCAVCDGTIGSITGNSDPESREVVLKAYGKEARLRAKVVVIATGLAGLPPPFRIQSSPRSRIGLGGLMERGCCRIPRGVLRMACSASGYVGVTAVEGERADVAAAVDPRALAAAKSAGTLINSILEDARFPSRLDAETIAWRGTPLLTRRATPLGAYRCLLIGDAARYVEPFTGEGIGWAMQSALLAAQLMGKRLDKWDVSLTATWSRLYERALGSHQRSCRVISSLLRVSPLRQAAVWGLRLSPGLSRPAVRRLDQPIKARLS